MKNYISNVVRKRAAALFGAAGVAMAVMSPIPLFAAIPAATPVSQLPLTITIPAHPQILLAVANSESMDGNLSGAIMTGSGSIPAALSALNASSSPVNFTIPAGFTPPLNPGSAGAAPYTVNIAGTLYDNSPSRLNVAKAGISAILANFMASADFGLLDYSTSGTSIYNTWVYQMSPPGGFTFTSVAAPTGQVANPCFGVNILLANQVSQDCNTLNGFYSSQNILTQPYMNISASSDDPSINDVLYAGGESPVCIVHGGPNPVNPYPPHFSLAQFNNGGFSVTEGYSTATPGPCATTTGPTNAGFVPYSKEVMYEQRGFGYGANQSATTGNIVVPMTTAGATPTAGSVAAALALFAPAMKPETSNSGTSEIKALAGQSPMAGLMSKAANYFATNPASSNGCTAKRYVILVTDGLPTFDLNGKTWPPLGSAAAAPTGYNVTATFNVDGSLATTNNQALTDVINKITLLNTAGISTYIVGLGAGVDPSKNPVAAQTLTAMAVAGGTGSYFAATDPTTLTNDLQSILGTILAATQSVASVAVNSTGLSTNSVVYQSQFVTSDVDQDWTGNLFAFNVNSSGVVDTLPADAIWAAATKLDAQNWIAGGTPNGRVIATYDPVVNHGIPFEWNPSTTATSGIAPSPSTTLGPQLTTFAPDTNGQDVLQYLRGSKTQEKQNGGQFRNRTHLLGDIVFSNPAYVAGPSANNLTSSYLAFAAAHASRPPVIYVGADDGMLHAFDAATGNERFAYIPRGVYGNLINLVSPFYNSRHLFFVDGSPQVADVQFSDMTWHSVLFGNEGAGGKSIFAIDVTDPSTITSEASLASAVLWDFTHFDMGLGFANPQIANTSAGTLLFVSNGYDSTNEKPFLYALNPQTGLTFFKVDLCAAVPTACNLGVANGLSTAIVVNTSGQSSAFANVAYAGDLQGNLWRVDISNPIPTSWTVSVILQARDLAGNRQPITAAPVATLNPKYPQIAGTMVFVGTGQLLGIPDLANANTQTIYGVFDPPAGYATPLTRSDLVQQMLSTGTVGTAPPVVVATVTNNAVSIPTNKGWFIDLTLNVGERVINPPVIKNGTLIITSTQPSPNSCTQGGVSYAYFINFATGSSFTTPQFDANGDGVVTVAGDTVGATHIVPLGIELGTGFYAGVTLEHTGSPNPSGCGLAGCSQPGNLGYWCQAGNATCTPRTILGPNTRRISWWEVRQ
jgi:type IV pilus assembly protein PilY1